MARSPPTSNERGGGQADPSSQARSAAPSGASTVKALTNALDQYSRSTDHNQPTTSFPSTSNVFLQPLLDSLGRPHSSPSTTLSPAPSNVASSLMTSYGSQPQPSQQQRSNGSSTYDTSPAYVANLLNSTKAGVGSPFSTTAGSPMASTPGGPSAPAGSRKRKAPPSYDNEHAGDVMVDQGGMSEGESPEPSGSGNTPGGGMPGDPAASRSLKTTKRAAQNRAAQRAFRERKDKYVKELERIRDEWNAWRARGSEIEQREKLVSDRERWVENREREMAGGGGGGEGSKSGDIAVKDSSGTSLSEMRTQYQSLIQTLQTRCTTLEIEINARKAADAGLNSTSTSQSSTMKEGELRRSLRDKDDTVSSLRRALEEVSSENGRLRRIVADYEDGVVNPAERLSTMTSTAVAPNVSGPGAATSPPAHAGPMIDPALVDAIAGIASPREHEHHHQQLQLQQQAVGRDGGAGNGINREGSDPARRTPGPGTSRLPLSAMTILGPSPPPPGGGVVSSTGSGLAPGLDPTATALLQAENERLRRQLAAVEGSSSSSSRSSIPASLFTTRPSVSVRHEQHAATQPMTTSAYTQSKSLSAAPAGGRSLAIPPSLSGLALLHDPSKPLPTDQTVYGTPGGVVAPGLEPIISARKLEATGGGGGGGKLEALVGAATAGGRVGEGSTGTGSGKGKEKETVDGKETAGGSGDVEMER